MRRSSFLRVGNEGNESLDRLCLRVGNDGHFPDWMTGPSMTVWATVLHSIESPLAAKSDGLVSEGVQVSSLVSVPQPCHRVIGQKVCL